MNNRDFSQVCEDFLKQLVELENDNTEANKVFKNFNKELNPIDRNRRQKNTLKKETCVAIIEKFYEVTKLNKNLNSIWGNYTNILKYNEINCRKKLIKLMENDCEKETIPPGVLGLFFNEKNDLARYITKKEIVIQAICIVENISINSLEKSKVIKDMEEFFLSIDGNFLKNLNNSSIMSEDEREEYFEDFYNRYKIKKEYVIELYLIIENVDKFSQLFDIFKETFDGSMVLDTSISVFNDPSDFVSFNKISNIKKLLKNFQKNIIKESVFLDNVYKMCIEDSSNKKILLNFMEKDIYPKELVSIIKDFEMTSYDNEIPKKFNFLSSNDNFPSSKKYYFNESNIDNLTIFNTIDSVKILDNEIIKSLEINPTETPFFFFDIKTMIMYRKEYLAYITIKRGKSFWIINCINPENQVFVFDFLEKIFTNIDISIVMYNFQQTMNKLCSFFKLAEKKMKKTISNIFSIHLIINSFVHKNSEDPEIKKIFPFTYKDVFVYNDEFKNLSNKNQSIKFVEKILDDGDSVMSQTIKNICKDLSFSQAVHLILEKPFDESEDTKYSFWQRNPLREAQMLSMKMRLNALEEMFMKLREIINKKMNLNYKKNYIPRTETFFNKYKLAIN
ncbi:Hypothetical protein SRAE_1000343700 [Strongyloides ratti]|uniref:Ribonuclease H-like domain-containing protein n=1 Tax=Strongyloides ratti TaxID=34506 RepID=A0A090MXC3_STRRB|nr:Hypothetical protein SRAE_1000343700 [Strongyloides ratti]CEF65184.1 Hypothetical protein SRAE_1000343700 [Strongyloides ratti]